MRRLILIIAAILPCAALSAQEAGTFAATGVPVDDNATARFIKNTTEIVRTYADLNDYSLIGVNGGVTFSQMQLNPPVKQTWLYNPVYASVMFTHYMKMFQYMPYFGYRIGLAYGREGYKFKKNKETGTIHMIDGATEATMEVVEMPFLAHMHFDALHFKIMADFGMYVGYRQSIERTGPSVTDALRRSFAETDRQWDYGLQGGAGLGLVFDPIEIHFNALLRFSWSSIYTPDSSPSIYNQYYYRFAYPFDLIITAGVHFQLTKRTGKTSAALKRQAREIVDNGWELDYEDTAGKDRQ